MFLFFCIGLLIIVAVYSLLLIAMMKRRINIFSNSYYVVILTEEMGFVMDFIQTSFGEVSTVQRYV